MVWKAESDMFFSKFPLIRYDINKDGNRKRAVDILKRVAFRKNLSEQMSLFQEYSVQEGDTPEIVATKFYGSAKLHWIVLLMNEIIDPYFKWPLSSNALDDYVAKKYPGKSFFLGNSQGLYFQRDEEVYVDGKKNVRGLVESYDPTYRELNLYNVQGTISSGDTLVGKTNGSTGEITRLVDLHTQAVHHFEDASTAYLYNEIDPLATPPVSGQQVAIGYTGDAFSTDTAATFGDTVLYSYVNSLDGNVTTHTAVTNEQYERDLNESRRSIKILRENYITAVIDDFSRVLKQ